jgi:hypothetical protein
MSIKIKLSEDQVLVIRASTEEWAKAYKRALDNNSVIEVHDAGRTLAINPKQILFWEEVPEEDDPPEQDPAPASVQRQPA